MQDLSNNIYQYYLKEFEYLSFEKQFHFSSRLYLWSQDLRTKQILQTLQSEYTQNGNPKVAIRNIIKKTKGSLAHGSKNATNLRQPYFEKYALLKTYVSVLFRITFLKTVYNLDLSAYFLELFDEEAIDQLAQALLADKKALAILSTHAVNFLYLYHKVIKQDDSILNPSIFINIGKTQYNLEDKVNLQLLIYLYTHCIIGESLFYRYKPRQHVETYRSMIREMEILIEANFNNINLDNKFEFLVCAKLVDQTSKLESRIFNEAADSISNDGYFLIDKHNNNPQSQNISLNKSEHRNVLFIMACRNFKALDHK